MAPNLFPEFGWRVIDETSDTLCYRKADSWLKGYVILSQKKGFTALSPEFNLIGKTNTFASAVFKCMKHYRTHSHFEFYQSE